MVSLLHPPHQLNLADGSKPKKKGLGPCVLLPLASGNCYAEWQATPPSSPSPSPPPPPPHSLSLPLCLSASVSVSLFLECMHTHIVGVAH